MAKDTDIETILRHLGPPEEIDRQMRQFKEAAKLLSTDQPRMIGKYPKQWIAVFQGSVAARGRTYASVLEQLNNQKIPRGQVVIRFIEKNHRTMIL